MFSHLKLWIAVARHNLTWVQISSIVHIRDPIPVIEAMLTLTAQGSTSVVISDVYMVSPP